MPKALHRNNSHSKYDNYFAFFFKGEKKQKRARLDQFPNLSSHGLHPQPALMFYRLISFLLKWEPLLILANF